MTEAPSLMALMTKRVRERRVFNKKSSKNLNPESERTMIERNPLSRIRRTDLKNDASTASNRKKSVAWIAMESRIIIQETCNNSIGLGMKLFISGTLEPGGNLSSVTGYSA